MPTKFAAQVRTASGVVVVVYASTVSELNSRVNDLSYGYPLGNSSSAIAQHNKGAKMQAPALQSFKDFVANVKTASGVVVAVYADTVSELNTAVNDLSYGYPLGNSSATIAQYNK